MLLPLKLIRINFQFELYLRVWSEKKRGNDHFFGTEMIAHCKVHIEHLNKAEIRIPS